MEEDAADKIVAMLEAAEVEEAKGAEAPAAGDLFFRSRRRRLRIPQAIERRSCCSCVLGRRPLSRVSH